MNVVIQLLFIATGIWEIDGARLAPAAWSTPLHLVAGAMIVFLVPFRVFSDREIRLPRTR